MIIALIFAAIALLVIYFLLCKFFDQFSDKDITHLSDASYLLNKDIEISRNRALDMKNSLEELHDSMKQLKMERESLMDKQYNLLYYQENLKKWTNEIKN